MTLLGWVVSTFKDFFSNSFEELDSCSVCELCNEEQGVCFVRDIGQAASSLEVTVAEVNGFSAARDKSVRSSFSEISTHQLSPYADTPVDPSRPASECGDGTESPLEDIDEPSDSFSISVNLWESGDALTPSHSTSAHSSIACGNCLPDHLQQLNLADVDNVKVESPPTSRHKNSPEAIMERDVCSTNSHLLAVNRQLPCYKVDDNNQVVKTVTPLPVACDPKLDESEAVSSQSVGNASACDQQVTISSAKTTSPCGGHVKRPRRSRSLTTVSEKLLKNNKYRKGKRSSSADSSGSSSSYVTATDRSPERLEDEPVCSKPVDIPAEIRKLALDRPIDGFKPMTRKSQPIRKGPLKAMALYGHTNATLSLLDGMPRSPPKPAYNYRPSYK